MRKIMLGLTTALAVGALSVPTMVSAAHMHGGNGGSHPNFSGSSAGKFSGRQSGPKSFAVHNNNFVNNNRVPNWKGQNWKGQNWAWNDRHHHRHGRNNFGFFGFVPFAAYGDYAAYDYCWQAQWTPNGYQRVYVCGPNEYRYF